MCHSLDTSAAASPPRTSTRRNATETTAKNTKIGAPTERGVPANPLGHRPALTVARYPDIEPYLNAVLFSK